MSEVIKFKKRTSEIGIGAGGGGGKSSAAVYMRAFYFIYRAPGSAVRFLYALSVNVCRMFSVCLRM